MMEQAKLLSMTAVLALLIWASADSLVNETVSVRVSFNVEPQADADMIVEIDPEAQSRWHEVQISGPRKTIESIEEPLEVRLLISDRPTGPASIPLDREMVKRALGEERSEFRRLTIISVQPSVVPIRVDHWVSHELAITLQRLTLAYQEVPQPRQMSTTVQMRESWYRSLSPTEQSQIDIAAKVEGTLRGRPPGERQDVLVHLDVGPYGPGAELKPPTIQVTAKVKADRTTEQIPTVPIKLAVSFVNLAKPYYAVARDGTTLTLETQTINVAGPTEDVARLLRGETRAFGFIQLKEADLEELGVFKAWIPSFHLPPNIELAEPPHPIEFKLIHAASAVTD